MISDLTAMVGGTLSFVTENVIEGKTTSFSDVTMGQWFYQDVTTLVDLSVVNGYSDGSFKPYNSVSVAEFMKMSLMACGRDISGDKGTTWYDAYINTAIDMNLIDRYYFDDYSRPITRGQMADIISRLLVLDYDNSQIYESSIKDFDRIDNDHKQSMLNVYIAGIFTGYEDGTLRSAYPASRAEAATVIIRMIDKDRRLPGVVRDFAAESGAEGLSVAGVYPGMQLSELIKFHGYPDEEYLSESGYIWYVYINDYKGMFFAGVEGSKVVAVFSNQIMESTLDISLASTESDLIKQLGGSVFNDYIAGVYKDLHYRFYSNANEADGLGGIYLYDDSISYEMDYSSEVLLGMEHLVFHMINGERVSRNIQALTWSDLARNSAWKHNLYMIDYGFGHEGINGSDSQVRMEYEGIDAWFYRENLAGGHKSAFDMHYSLMHSEKHRMNILDKDVEYVGIGISYDATSKYKFYITQDYYGYND